MKRTMRIIDNDIRKLRILAPSSLNEGLFPLNFNFSYRKLPQQLINLSVLKLDGSSFDVCVARNATVEELKQAVEEVFCYSPREGEGKISWSHVWGHFCLCYEDQKLVNDKAYVRNFGIKDGVQIEFIRHLSINYRPAKQRPNNQNFASRQCSMFALESDAHGENKQTGANDSDRTDDEETIICNNHVENDEETPMPEFKLAHLLKGWLLYSKLWGGATRKELGGKARLSRFSLHSRIIQL